MRGHRFTGGAGPMRSDAQWSEEARKSSARATCAGALLHIGGGDDSGYSCGHCAEYCLHTKVYMLKITAMLAGLLLAASPVLAQAPAGPTPPTAADPAALFGARPLASGMRLSPSGRRIAFLTPAGGDRTAVMVVDLDSTQSRPVLSDRDSNIGVDWCGWKTDDRLICGTSGITRVDGAVRIGFSRVFSMAVDGRDMKMLTQRDTVGQLGIRQRGGRVIDWLPDDPDHVLMEVDIIPEDSVGSRTAERREGLGVARVNVRTASRSMVEPPKRSASGFIAHAGVPRIMAVVPETVTGAFSSEIRYLHRPAGGGEWSLIVDSSMAQRETGLRVATDVASAGMDADGRRALFLEPENGRVALVARTPGGGRELLFAHPRVDIDGVWRIGQARRPVAAVYTLDATEFHYFDADLGRLTERLSAALPGKPRVFVLDESRDGAIKLILAERDAEPGRYFTFNTATRQLEELLAERPQLAGRTLGAVRPVSYAARDGVEVPGYLTLPPGRTDARGLPAIVMPHGGPAARDQYGFDWLAQYFAAKGFAVLQPNFRGSAGYGADWYVDNGFRSWPIAIGDINDGARWLVAQGADPTRLAILGWSYGGYAALMGASVDPALYKAVVAVAPVTDLPLLKTQARDFKNSELVADFVGEGQHTIDGSPARQAARIAAPVLLIHGDQDLNVDIAHSRRMADALKGAGKRHELVVYPGLEHSLVDSDKRADLLRRAAAWIEAAIGPVAPPAAAVAAR